MSDQLVEREVAAEKDALLSALVPRTAYDELERVRRRGISVEVGSTPDPAYENPEGIRAMFAMLHDYGLRFAAGRGVTELGQRILSVLAMAPLGRLSSWAKGRLRRRRQKDEALRGRIMYDTPDVQGQPWHRQNGRAAALITIVDAHELRTSRDDGRYLRMSGRLDGSIFETVFDARAGWLQGMNLRDAVTASAVRFRDWSLERATAFADREVTALQTFIDAEPQPGFREIVGFCVDSLGIRSRKIEVHDEIHRHAHASNATHLVMLSIGCGTALPMLEVLASLREQGRDGHLILIDQDPIALAAAQLLATQLGLHDAVEIHCERLILGSGRRSHVLDLDAILGGRQVDVCEDSGLREYFPNFLYRELARKAYAATKPGGLVTTGNMNKYRPQPEFLHGMMGWPIPVQMRSASQVVRLHRQAGVPVDRLRLRMTQDGVYVLCFITKDLG